MSAICCLKPNVSRAEAEESFSPSGWRGRFQAAVRGPLRSVADVYIPFRLYRVEIENGGKKDTRLLALDSVSGVLDLYGFDQVPGPEDVTYLETRNHPEARLEESRARELVAEKVRRLIFLTGFFRVRDFAIRVEPLSFEFHVPYWVGFFGSGAEADLAVLDAVRRRAEGAKARTLMRDWLTQ